MAIANRDTSSTELSTLNERLRYKKAIVVELGGGDVRIRG